MKKTLVLLSVVLLVVGLAIPAAAQAKRFDGVTLRVFANSHDPMLKAVKWSIQAAKDQLGIDVLFDEAAYGVQYDKATTAFASGAGQYDIIVAAHQWTGAWTEAGYLEPLDPLIKADKTFDPSIYSPKAYTINSTVNGKQVGLPFNMEGRLMFYRKDIFSAEKLKVPTTEAEWLRVVKYFADNRARMTAKYGSNFYGATYMYGGEQGPAYPFSTYWGKFNWKAYKTDNGFWDDKYQNIMDEKLLAQSFKFWQDVMKYMPPGVETFNLPEAYQYFVDGKTAMTEVWPLTLYGMLLDPANDKIRKVTGVANIAYGLPFSGGWAICMTSSCKNKDAAWAYLKMMTSAQADFEFFRDYGKGPSVKATFTNPALSDKYGEWLKNQGEAVAVAVSPGKIGTMSEFYGGDFWKIADQTMIGKLSATEGAKRMVKEMDGLLERAGYKQNNPH
ncbi:MAG: extracellular solute-binding protein [Spirochaetia bacterium]|jgi:multiple sugar transport system substrate-binding protein